MSWRRPIDDITVADIVEIFDGPLQWPNVSMEKRSPAPNGMKLSLKAPFTGESCD